MLMLTSALRTPAPMAAPATMVPTVTLAHVPRASLVATARSTSTSAPQAPARTAAPALMKQTSTSAHVHMVSAAHIVKLCGMSVLLALARTAGAALSTQTHVHSNAPAQTASLGSHVRSTSTIARLLAVCTAAALTLYTATAATAIPAGLASAA
jgi:hypothetical protein